MQWERIAKKSDKMASKRKFEKRDDLSHPKSDPVEISLLNDFNNKGVLEDSFCLQATIREMATASTYYVQLSSLQRLKNRLTEVKENHSSTSISRPNETLGVLSWLIRLYLFDASIPLRKTLVGVITVAYDRCTNEGSYVSLVELLISQYFMSSIQSFDFASSSSSSSIVETGVAIATLVGVLDFPILSNSLLSSNQRIEDIMTFLGSHLSLHMSMLTNLTRGEQQSSLVSGESVASLECSGFVLKALIQLLGTQQGMKWKYSATCSSSESSVSSTSKDFIHVLIECCLTLLGDGNGGQVQKDQLTQAALSLVLLLRGVFHDENEDMHWLEMIFQLSQSSSYKTMNMSEEGSYFRAMVSKRSKLFPPISKLSVLRGIIHSVRASTLFSNHDGGIGFELLSSVITACEDPSPPIQLYAFQVLDSFCGRLVTLISSSSIPSVSSGSCSEIGDLIPLIQRVVDQSIDLILRCWESPNKGLARILPSIFSRVVDLEASIYKRNEDGNEDGSDTWSLLLERLCAQPSKRKGKYTSLSVLIPHLVKTQQCHNDNHHAKKEKTILNLLTTLTPIIIEAVSSTTAHSVAPSATALFSQLLNTLKQLQQEKRKHYGLTLNPDSVSNRALKKSMKRKKEKKRRREEEEREDKTEQMNQELKEKENSCLEFENESRGIWMKHMVKSLLSPSSLVRTRCADYLLAEAVRLDQGSVLSLIYELRESVAQSQSYACSVGGASVQNVGEDGDAGCMSIQDRLLWALVHVVRYGRLHGCSSVDNIISNDNHDTMITDEGLLSFCEFSSALVHFHDDLRLAALEIICSNTKTKTFPNQIELNLLMKSLPISLNCSSPEHRHRIMRFVQRLLMRARVCSSSSSTPTGFDNTNNDEDNIQFRVKELVHWLCHELLKQLYPGAPFSRELLALELLNLSFIELVDNSDGSNKSKGNHKKNLNGTSGLSLKGENDSEVTQLTESLGEILKNEIHTKSSCHTFLLLLLSTWDRSRSLAKLLLLRFPAPFPGINLMYLNSQNNQTLLLTEALAFTASPRQTEAEAGAHILHLLLQAYVINNNIPIRICSSQSSGYVNPEVEHKTDLVYVFIKELVDLLSFRLDKLVGHFKKIHNGHGSYAPAVGDFEYRAQQEKSGTTTDDTVNDGGDRMNDDSGMDTQEDDNTIELVNGLIVALKLSVESSISFLPELQQMQNDQSGGVTVQYTVYDWCDLFEMCAAVILNALDVAMLVVADQSSGQEQEDQGITNKSELQQCLTNPGALQKPIGEVSTSAASTSSAYGEDIGAAARSLPLNSSLSSNQPSAEVNELIKFQTAVVGSWQMARDACICLASFVKVLPLPSDGDENDIIAVRASSSLLASSKNAQIPVFISVKTVSKIGHTLLDALQRLKHTGAIAAAQQGFQELCKALLAPERVDKSNYYQTSIVPSSHEENGQNEAAPKKKGRGQVDKVNTSGTKKISAKLRALPMEWAQATVKRLQEFDGSLYVLRRSASYGSSFISICRSDASLTNQGPPTVFPFVLYHLLILASSNILRGKELIDALVHLKEIDKGRHETSGEESSDDNWQIGVHALNVLRLIFLDAFVGEAVHAYVSLAVKVAVRGFSHREWAIRNSSTLLFAAIIQRTVANQKNVSVGSGGVIASSLPSCFFVSKSLEFVDQSSLKAQIEDNLLEGATASEFFHRFPDLASFILFEMKKATTNSTTRDNNEEESENDETIGAVHPSLVPLLLLLSRLRPSSETFEQNLVLEKNHMTSDHNEKETVCSLAEFLKLLLLDILNCRDQRHHTARVMAARSAAAICPLDQAANLAVELILSLPNAIQFYSSSQNGMAVDKEEINDDDDDDAPENISMFQVPPCPSTNNAIHGTLLLIKELTAMASKHTLASTSSTASISTSSSSLSCPSNLEEDSLFDPIPTSSLDFLFQMISLHVLPIIHNIHFTPPLRLAALQIPITIGAILGSLMSPLKSQNSFFLNQMIIESKKCILKATTNEITNQDNSRMNNLETHCTVAPWSSLLKMQLTRLSLFFWFQHCNDNNNVFMDNKDFNQVLSFYHLTTPISSSSTSNNATCLPNVIYLESLFNCRNHDIKVSAIKALKKVLLHSNYGYLLLTNNESSTKSFYDLTKNLEDLLVIETYPPSQRRLLICLCEMRKLTERFQHMKQDSYLIATDMLWGTLEQLHVSNTQISAKEENGYGDVPAKALELMGHELKRLCLLQDDLRNGVLYLDRLVKWVARLSKASQPHMNLAMRLSSVESIRSSNLLNLEHLKTLMVQFSSSSSSSSSHELSDLLVPWFACFNLALDDDCQVRNVTSMVLKQHHGTTTMRKPDKADLYRPCNSVVLEKSMNSLTQFIVEFSTDESIHDTFNYLEEYEEKLFQLWKLVAFENGYDNFNEENASISKPIFEPEEDNMFTEPIFVVQLVMKQLIYIWSIKRKSTSIAIGVKQRIESITFNQLTTLKHHMNLPHSSHVDLLNVNQVILSFRQVFAKLSGVLILNSSSSKNISFDRPDSIEQIMNLLIEFATNNVMSRYLENSLHPLLRGVMVIHGPVDNAFYFLSSSDVH